MNPIKFFAVVLLFFTSTVQAAGLLKPKTANYQDLQIQSHRVNVTIADGFATTEIDQQFYNPNQQSLEAIYSFPVPSQAAVGEFTYWIDGQAVTGEVLEKQQARDLYENQRQAGQAAALVEQDSHKTFDMAVYPVKPLDSVRIRLVYVQPTATDTGIGRYLYPLEAGGVDKARDAFWTRNEQVQGDFQFYLRLRTAYPLDGVRLPNHPNAQVKQLNEKEYEVSLMQSSTSVGSAQRHLQKDDLGPTLDQSISNQESESAMPSQALQQTSAVFNLNQDIVVYWRHKEGLPGALDMITYRNPETEAEGNAAEGNVKGTFMLTLTPAMDLQTIQQGRDWIFVLDISGSMTGKYQTLVEGVRRGLGQLPAEDRYRVIVFNNSASDMTQGYRPATPGDIETTLQQLEQIQANGGTNLYAGLKKAMAKLDSDRTSGLILVTDGVANVGVTEKKRFLDLMEQTDVRLFSFIMGNESNRPLLQGMSDISAGFYQEISNADDILGQILLATGKLQHQALRDIKIEINGVKVTDLTPKTVTSLYRGEQLHVLGHFWESGQASIAVEGKINGHTKRYQTRVQFPENSTRYPELERLWAFASIQNLMQQQQYFGESADTRQAIVDLALANDLVTDYTSMVVVQEAVFQAQKIARDNQQRTQREQAARQQRLAEPVTSTRVDSEQPMFDPALDRPSVGSGGIGGSMGVEWIGLGLLAVWLRRRGW